MRIVVITKRQYMSKDLIDDRYGRFYEMPLELSKLGHEVIGVALSYRKSDEGILIDNVEEHNKFQWHSYNLKDFILPRFKRHQDRLQSITQSFQADVIWSCSDAIHAIIGSNLSKRTGIPCVIDLYDNFESYGLSHIPGILPLFKRAIENAKSTTCISQALAHYVISNYKPKNPVSVIENAIPSNLFKPMEKTFCRQHLGLPVNARYIGTAGALNNGRGINILFDGYKQLVSEHKDLHLLVAGPVGKNVILPNGDKVHYLGNLPYNEIPFLINSLDLAVVCNLDTNFGKFCFPQKIYEFMACHIPFIAAAVGPTKTLLENNTDCLYQADDIGDFLSTATHQLKHPRRPEISIPTWRDQAIKLESTLNFSIN